MSENKQNQSKQKSQRKFNQNQCEMLLRCSEKEDVTEWNEWRKKNPDEDILLEGVDFSKHVLRNVHFNTGIVIEDSPSKQPYKLKGVVHLEGSKFVDAHMEYGQFIEAHLEGAEFINAHLEHAGFGGVHMEGTNFTKAHVQGANFGVAIVDGRTLLWKCGVDSDTYFHGTGLDRLRVDAGTKQLLEYNIRLKNWEWWYEKGCWLTRLLKKAFVRSFWWMSDYGRRTGRIIITFFGLAFLFAIVYRIWPTLVIVNYVVGDIRSFVHALYFSVVTMTTLGFGDIAANPDSCVGQILLMIQVILGYVLLGALVTRFAVLFTAGGPSGKFSKKK